MKGLCYLAVLVAVLGLIVLGCEKAPNPVEVPLSEQSGVGSLAKASTNDIHVRWDIISFQPPNARAGGVASARANDKSKITLTGSGTFSVGDESEDVTGGGTWKTFDPAGILTGMGTFKVKRLVRWENAPGTLPTPPIDLIGNPDERSAGLAILLIRYSDGKRGVLVVSCQLIGTPASVFEGITATKDFVAYTFPELPVAGVDANRTLFHVSEAEEEDDATNQTSSSHQ